MQDFHSRKTNPKAKSGGGGGENSYPSERKEHRVGFHQNSIRQLVARHLNDKTDPQGVL